MAEEEKELHDEIADLKQELEHFQQEKERVRAIVGKIGGMPEFNTKIINIAFITIILLTLVLSIIVGERWRFLMIELATVTLSLKIIYLIHCQMRINHFKFWILSSIEWRLNEIMKLTKELKEE